MKRLIAMSLLTIFLTFTPAVLAQTPGRVRTATPSSEPRTETKDRIATRVAELKSANKFVVGKIVTIDGNNIVLNLPNGRSLNIQTDATTKFVDISASRRVITIKNLAVGQRIAASGLGPEDTSGIAKLILKLPTENPRTTIYGTITKVDVATSSSSRNATSSATVTIQQRTGTASAVLVTKDTKLKIKGDDTPTLSELKVGQKAVVTGPRNSNPLTAFHFYVIATDPKLTGGNQTATRSASPSAKPTTRAATPSGSRR